MWRGNEYKWITSYFYRYIYVFVYILSNNVEFIQCWQPIFLNYSEMTHFYLAYIHLIFISRMRLKEFFLIGKKYNSEFLDITSNVFMLTQFKIQFWISLPVSNLYCNKTSMQKIFPSYDLHFTLKKLFNWLCLRGCN